MDMTVEKELWEFVGPACKTPPTVAISIVLPIGTHVGDSNPSLAPKHLETEGSESLSSSLVSTDEHEKVSLVPSTSIYPFAQTRTAKGLT